MSETLEEVIRYAYSKGWNSPSELAPVIKRSVWLAQLIESRELTALDWDGDPT